MFSQKHPFDAAKLKPRISELFGREIDTMTSSFEPSGYTGSVHKVMVRFADGENTALIAKYSADDRDFRFYKEVLEPFKLNSPAIYGIAESFLIIEYVAHSPAPFMHGESQDSLYLQGLDWLIRKDRVCAAEISKLKNAASVRPSLNTGESWWESMLLSAEARAHPLISVELIRRLSDRKDLLALCNRELSSGALSICHNDFQEANILQAEDGSLYVIDWTNPCIGSPLIDLARLISMAPPRLRSELALRYEKAAGIPGFEKLLTLAMFRTRLSVFTWMCRAALDGQARSIDERYDMGAWVEDLERSAIEAAAIAV